MISLPIKLFQDTVLASKNPIRILLEKFYHVLCQTLSPVLGHQDQVVVQLERRMACRLV